MMIKSIYSFILCDTYQSVVTVPRPCPTIQSKFILTLSFFLSTISKLAQQRLCRSWKKHNHKMCILYTCITVSFAVVGHSQHCTLVSLGRHLIWQLWSSNPLSTLRESKQHRLFQSNNPIKKLSVGVAATQGSFLYRFIFIYFFMSVLCHFSPVCIWAHRQQTYRLLLETWISGLTSLYCLHCSLPINTAHIKVRPPPATACAAVSPDHFTWL